MRSVPCGSLALDIALLKAKRMIYALRYVLELVLLVCLVDFCMRKSGMIWDNQFKIFSISIFNGCQLCFTGIRNQK